MSQGDDLRHPPEVFRQGARILEGHDGRLESLAVQSLRQADRLVSIPHGGVGQFCGRSLHGTGRRLFWPQDPQRRLACHVRTTSKVEPETLEHPVNQGSHNAIRLTMRSRENLTTGRPSGLGDG